MSERLSIVLLVCLTLLGMVALGGMVTLQALDRPIPGSLAAVSAGVVVALTGLMAAWGKSLQPVLARVAALDAKLDDNTKATKAVDEKAATIVQQTNGVTAVLQGTVDQLVERIAKLETYNHDTAHKINGALDALPVRVAVIMAAREQQKSEGPAAPKAGV